MTDLRTKVRAALLAPPVKDPTGNLTASFCFYPDFPGFQGHFPGNPVLPGIVQILMVEVTIGREKPVILTEVARCRFLRPVLPGENVTVTANPTGEGQWTSTLTVNSEICARMTLFFTAALL